MKSSQVSKAVVIFWVFTALTVLLRFVLQFTAIDQSTGFYTLTPLGDIGQWVYNILLLVGGVAIWFTTKHATSKLSHSDVTGSGSIFIAFMAMGLVTELIHFFAFYVEMSDLMGGHAPHIPAMLPTITGVLGGVVFMYMGFLGIVGKQNRIGLFAAGFISLWGAATLLFLYMDYPIVFSISDNMLHILTMTALTFLIVSVMKSLKGINPEASAGRSLLFALLTMFFGLNLMLPKMTALLMGYITEGSDIFQMLGMLAMGYGENTLLPMPNLLDMLFVLTGCALAFFVMRSLNMPTEHRQQDPLTPDTTSMDLPQE